MKSLALNARNNQETAKPAALADDQAQCLDDAAAAANKDLRSGAARNGQIGELFGVFWGELG